MEIALHRDTAMHVTGRLEVAGPRVVKTVRHMDVLVSLLGGMQAHHEVVLELLRWMYCLADYVQTLT